MYVEQGQAKQCTYVSMCTFISMLAEWIEDMAWNTFVCVSFYKQHLRLCFFL